MITNAGGGYSKWNNIAVTRWREDATCDNWGNFCFIRDVDNDTYWSSTYQPTAKQGKTYEVVFSQGRAEFRRRDYDIESHTEIVVSPEDDIEIRRVHLTNHSRKPRTIEITSYAEVKFSLPQLETSASSSISVIYLSRLKSTNRAMRLFAREDHVQMMKGHPGCFT